MTSHKLNITRKRVEQAENTEAEEADYHSQAGAGGYSSLTIINEFQDWDGIVHGGKLRNSGRLDWEAGFKSVIRDN